MVKLATPTCARRVSKRAWEIQNAFDELDVCGFESFTSWESKDHMSADIYHEQEYMLEMVQTREKSDKADLFSSLLKENSAGGEKAALSVREMVGNIFVLLVAGHETAAHTLCFTFLLLALHQEEQEKLFQQVEGLLPGGRAPTYEEMPLFTQAMAIYYETLRMYPPVTWIPKVCAEDTVLTATSADGTRTEQVPVHAGTNITVDVVGLHYNPRYWEEPSEFKPSRFIGEWNKDAFIPFSTGSHACLGRKFFEYEAIAILAMLISKYQIEIPTKDGETFEQKKARVLATTTAITLTPGHIPVTFRRRDS
ncbi:hypothetical protein AAF712_009600 [Marasmius tenuissimus]|uniref:Cytochrome P450 n=1 Tax=Marasmius tenuissimus TaxID=585030 RepID=A0ABR2ZRL2_9AGAR